MSLDYTFLGNKAKNVDFFLITLLTHRSQCDSIKTGTETGWQTFRGMSKVSDHQTNPDKPLLPNSNLDSFKKGFMFLEYVEPHYLIFAIKF